MAVPVLRGCRVTLRPRDYDKDLEGYLRWLNDPEMWYWEEPWTEFEPRSREEFVKGWKEAQAKAKTTPPAHLEGQWQIDTSEGQHIGRIVHSEIRESNRCRSCEIGIVIWAKELWGKGYGTDAVRMLVRYLFEHEGLRRVELSTWSGNVGMIRCAEKCGFEREGIRREAVLNLRDGKYYDSLLFGILDREFKRPE